jgi:hypothetical protein
MLVVHPRGWHDVNRGLAASEARMVSVSEVPLANVLTTAADQIDVHSGGGTKGVVRGRKKSSVGDTGRVEVVRVAEIEVCCAVSAIRLRIRW